MPSHSLTYALRTLPAALVLIGLLPAPGRAAVLSSGNSFTGATTVASAAAQGLASDALAFTSGIQVAAGGELQIVDSNVQTTLTAPIALGGTLSSSVDLGPPAA